MFQSDFYVLARLSLRQLLRKQGRSLTQIDNAVSDASDEMIDLAYGVSGVSAPSTILQTTNPTAGVLATLIAAITAFLSGSVGQQLLAELVKLLGA